MKRLEIIARLERLEDLRGTLEGCRANDIMISNIMGHGNQKGYTQICRGTMYTVNLFPRMKVETVVSEGIAETVIDKAVKGTIAGNYGDGKASIYDVQDVVRIRAGKRDVEALQQFKFTHDPSIINRDNCTCSHPRFLVEIHGICKERG